MTKKEQEILVKKAYAKGFITSAVIGGLNENQAKTLYKQSSVLADKIRSKHERIKQTILSSQN